MKKLFAIIAGLSIAGAAAFAEGTLTIDVSKKPVTNGWADLGKISYNTKKVRVIDDATYPDPIKKRKAFTEAIYASKTLVILSGDVNLSDGKVTDQDKSYFDKFSPSDHKRINADFMYTISPNTTIIGKDNARIMFGGLAFPTGGNLIIRNVTFYDAHGSTEIDTKHDEDSKASCDAFVIGDKKMDTPSGIWIDHCTFTDGTCDDMIRNFNHDGLIDIPFGKNITISYCEFTNHDKVMLVASADSYTEQTDRQITLHHNYFHHVTQRNPRSRGCQIHIYNNVYDDIGVPKNTGYMFGPGIGSNYIIENNYLGSHLSSMAGFYDKSKSPKDSTFARIYQSGNSVEMTAKDMTFQGSTSVHNFENHVSATKMFKIPYAYEMSSWEEAKADVMENYGANKQVEIIGLKTK